MKAKIMDEVTTTTNTPTWNPNLGTKIGPAWRAIVTNLTQREWGALEVAADIAMHASGIKRTTARNLIRDAIRHGYLQTETHPTTRGRTYQRIRLTTKGKTLPVGTTETTERHTP